MSFDFWKDKYNPDRILKYDINKCLFIKNNDIHFVMWELSGREAIHLIDNELEQLFYFDYEALSHLFQNYLIKNY